MPVGLYSFSKGQTSFEQEICFYRKQRYYALCGESLRYWNFYPYSEPIFLPVRGYAEVSNLESLSCIGVSFYGYRLRLNWPAEFIEFVQ